MQESPALKQTFGHVPIAPAPGRSRNRRQTCSKWSIWCENEKSEYWKHFPFYISPLSDSLYFFIPDTCFQSQTASFSSFSLACRQIHPPSCTLTLFKRFSSFVYEKRNYLALERNCPGVHGLFYSVALSDSVSSHLTFFWPNLPRTENLLNGKGNKFKYSGYCFHI